MVWRICLDSSIPSNFIRYVIKVTRFPVEECNEEACGLIGSERPALTDGNDTIVGAQDVAKVLASYTTELGLVTEEALKFVNYVLTDIYQAVSGELKMGLSVLHRLNKIVLNVTYLVDNHLTVADLCLFATLEPGIREGQLSGASIVNVFRWFDLIQHVLKKDFVPDLQTFSFRFETNNAPKTSVEDSKTNKISKVDFRVAKIVEIQMHPNASMQYVEKVYLGEEGGYRTIVSGLVKYVPMEQLQDRLVVIVANLKPIKIRDVLSCGMLLAVSNEDGTVVEVVDPPLNSIVGERIMVQDCQYSKDYQPEINKKIFKSIAPLLLTNENFVACYDNKPLVTSAGPCTVVSLKNAHLS